MLAIRRITRSVWVPVRGARRRSGASSLQRGVRLCAIVLDWHICVGLTTSGQQEKCTYA